MNEKESDPPALKLGDLREFIDKNVARYLKVKARRAVNLVEASEKAQSWFLPRRHITSTLGLHSEHHDFAAIPWTRLPTVINMEETQRNRLLPSYYIIHIPHVLTEMSSSCTSS